MGNHSSVGSIYISMLFNKLGDIMKTLTIQEYIQKQVEHIRLTVINNPNKLLARPAPNRCRYCELKEESSLWKL